MKNNQLHESISKLITERLARRSGEKLNSATCSQIYQDIFFTLAEVFKEAQAPLSNESVNLLSQMYYDSIKINQTIDLDPNIFTQRANLSNIPTKEVALLATMMSDTPFSPVFVSEIKRRS